MAKKRSIAVENARYVGITDDLMRKVVDDVRDVIFRTIDIAPKPHLPIVTAAGALALGFAAAELAILNGKREPGSDPEPEYLLLAALLIARIGMKCDDPHCSALNDLALLKKADRLRVFGAGEDRP